MCACGCECECVCVSVCVCVCVCVCATIHCKSTSVRELGVWGWNYVYSAKLPPSCNIPISSCNIPIPSCTVPISGCPMTELFFCCGTFYFWQLQAEVLLETATPWSEALSIGLTIFTVDKDEQSNSLGEMDGNDQRRVIVICLTE